MSMFNYNPQFKQERQLTPDMMGALRGQQQATSGINDILSGVQGQWDNEAAAEASVKAETLKDLRGQRTAETKHNREIEMSQVEHLKSLGLEEAKAKNVAKQNRKKREFESSENKLKRAFEESQANNLRTGSEISADLKYDRDVSMEGVKHKNRLAEALAKNTDKNRPNEKVFETIEKQGGMTKMVDDAVGLLDDEQFFIDREYDKKSMDAIKGYTQSLLLKNPQYQDLFRTDPKGFVKMLVESGGVTDESYSPFQKSKGIFGSFGFDEWTPDTSEEQIKVLEERLKTLQGK